MDNEREHSGKCDDRIALTVRAVLDDFRRDLKLELRERDATFIVEMERKFELIAKKSSEISEINSFARSKEYIDNTLMKINRFDHNDPKQLTEMHDIDSYVRNLFARATKYGNLVWDWGFKNLCGLFVGGLIFLGYKAWLIANDPTIKLFTGGVR